MHGLRSDAYPFTVISIIFVENFKDFQKTNRADCQSNTPLCATEYTKTHVRLKSPHPVRNLDWAFFWVGLGTDFSLQHRSNCGRMPFLTPPMALMGFEHTTQWPWAASLIHWAKAAQNIHVFKTDLYILCKTHISCMWTRLQKEYILKSNRLQMYCPPSKTQ